MAVDTVDYIWVSSCVVIVVVVVSGGGGGVGSSLEWV